MFAQIKKLLNDWREDRQQLRELTIKLENLTDPTFLNRALSPHPYPLHANCRCAIEVRR